MHNDNFSTSEINRIDRAFGIRSGQVEVENSKRINSNESELKFAYNFRPRPDPILSRRRVVLLIYPKARSIRLFSLVEYLSPIIHIVQGILIPCNGPLLMSPTVPTWKRKPTMSCIDLPKSGAFDGSRQLLKLRDACKNARMSKYLTYLLGN